VDSALAVLVVMLAQVSEMILRLMPIWARSDWNSCAAWLVCSSCDWVWIWIGRPIGAPSA
jgi:hypothetical protein